MAMCLSGVVMDAKEEENSLGPNWLELPRDVTAMILKKLNDLEILLSARQVCSLWWNICKDPLMWRTIHLKSDNSVPLPCPFNDICCYAIDQSYGHLEDINVGCNGSDYLLKYICDSTSQLRCLRLGDWDGRISDRGLVEVADKLRLLEELEIFVCYLSKVSLEAIGRCCPRLTVLKFKSYFSGSEDDDLLLAIAKNMPQLRRLHISVFKVSKAGLFAILDACPHLESLYIGNYVDMDGCVQKQCVERNIDFRCIDNSIYEDSDDDYSDDDIFYDYYVGTDLDYDSDYLFRVDNYVECDYG